MTRLNDAEISLAQMRCFVAVADGGSVAEAARRQGMSKALGRLEDAAGLRLFHRSTHSMSLTEEGQAVLGAARDAVSASSSFIDAVAQRADGGEAGVVRVTAAVGFVRHVLAPLMGEWARLHPNIKLDVRATNEILDLAEGGIDIALRSGPLEGLPGLIQQPWFSAPWIVCAAPCYLEHRGVPDSYAALAGHDLLGFRNRRTGRVQPWPFRNPSGDAGGRFDPPSCTSFDDGDATFAAILGGAGIGCAPLWLAAPALRTGAAVEVLADWRDEAVGIAMLRRARKLTPKRVTSLMDFLRTRTPNLSDLM